MPAQSKQDTLARLLELLKALPHHRWATPAELRAQLVDRGYSVDLRSVQRDLKELQQHFPLDHNDKGRPHGWRWSAEAAGGIAAMSTPEALMLVLVQQQLRAALPATMLEGFESLFARARQRLDRLGPRAGASRWPAKVRAVPPGLKQLAPTIDASVQKAIADALLADRQIQVLYAPGPQGELKPYRLHPVGLLLRGGITYLAATRGQGTGAVLYALHRFRRVEALPEPALIPEGFDLDTALARGRGQFGVALDDASPLRLKLACAPVLAGLLQEAPLADDQRVRGLSDGRIEVQASVPDSWELRWWLMGRGAEVEVLGPAQLRREIAQRLRDAGRHYDND